MPILLEATNVSIEYEKRGDRSRLRALQDLTLSVETGEFLVVVGPSGCGKTTFLNAVAGLVQPAAGSLTMDGRPIAGPGPDRAMVFQEYALMPWLATWDNVAFGLDLRGQLRQEEARRRVAQFIELVGLRGFERSYPHELSGGMRQRVGLARALVVEPRLLLMDEPFAAVDAMTREIMRAEFERILSGAGRTVILVTHSIDEAIAFGDRIVVISSRPRRVREILTVDLPRPRWDYDVKAHHGFGPLRERVWHVLQQDVPGLPRGRH